MPRTARGLSLAVLALATALSAAAAAPGADAAKWFVLRGETTGNCWTARLIVMNGQYASGSGRIAGGPYDTEADAQARLAALKDAATCR